MTLHDDLVKYEDFYNGKKETIFSEFKARFVDTANISSTSQFNDRNFYFQNDVRVIQDSRVNFMPTIFDVTVSNDSGEPNEQKTETVNDWLDGPYFGGGKSFWEALPGYYLTHENNGTLFLMLYKKDGVVNVNKLYSEDVTILTNPKNINDITSYTFEWEEEVDVGGEGTRNVQMKLVVDNKTYRTTQGGVTVKDESHGFKIIPIVKIVREEVKGSPYGRSGIADLIEPQNEVNMALTKRAWATKYNSFRVWAPKDSTVSVPAGAALVISPGSMVPVPIESVGGDINMTAVENELNDALDYLYRIGCIPRKLKEETVAANTSGKALNTLLQALKIYTDKKQVYLKRGFEELISYAFDIDLKYITITWPDDDDEDPAVILDRARFLNEIGFIDEALRILGFEDRKIAEMMKEKEKADAERDAKAEEIRQKFMQDNQDNSDNPNDQGDDQSKDTSTAAPSAK